MPFIDPISVSEAAQELGLSPARIRVMAAEGQLTAEKVGGRWLLERGKVKLRGQAEVFGGRRFTSRNAWALLQLLSEEEVSDLSPSARSRLKRTLLAKGLKGVAQRLGNRAEISFYRAHPGELANIREDPVLRPTAGTVVARWGVLPSPGADGYLPVAEVADFVRRHALLPADPPNVILRAVPDDVWGQITDSPIVPQAAAMAPRAAMVLDLIEAGDPRLNEAGLAALKALERNYRKAAKAGR